MDIFKRLKRAVVPDTDPGVILRCVECGETFDEPRGTCPACGSHEIKEEEGFDMRPDS